MPNRLQYTILAACVGILLHSTAFADTSSVYVRLDDGVRLAVDLHLPDVTAPAIALVVMTRYGRATRFSAREIEALLQRGLAVVTADMRGSGASEGSRHALFSSEERDDIGQLLDWIAGQPWSNGRIIATGVSYDANLAEFAQIARPSILTGVIPRFGDYDLYRHLMAPGGIRNDFLLKAWSGFVRRADESIDCLLDAVACAGQPHLKPADNDRDYRVLRAALLEHQQNWNPYKSVFGYEYIDDLTPAGRALQDGFLSSHYQALSRARTPLQIWASWLDAATAETALIRYLVAADAPVEVYIGAWSHGGGVYVDPLLTDKQRAEGDGLDADAQLVRFTEDRQAGKTPARQIHYYTMGSQQWRSTSVWPPVGVNSSRLHFDAGHSLALHPVSAAAGADVHTINDAATTGTANRWYTQMGGGNVDYGTWSPAAQRHLLYRSPPLAHDLEITGSPEAQLFVASSHPDAALYVYLSAVAPDGREIYLTEGQLRLRNRAAAKPSPAFPHPFESVHSHLRNAARPMPPGAVERVAIRLLPVSALLPKHYRIQISIAGHDADTFARYPSSGDVGLTIHRSSHRPSNIVLPHAGDVAFAPQRGHLRAESAGD